MWRRLFSGKSIQSVTGAAMVIAAAGIVSRVLGFVRDRVLANQFGAGDILDAYYAAFRVPDFLYGLLVLGALSAAFVPVFTEVRERDTGEVDSWRLSNRVLQLLGAALGVASILLFLFVDGVTSFLVPGFDGEKRVLTEQLTSIMLLSPIFLGISAVFGGILVSLKKFLWYSLAPIFYNLGIIVGALVFARFVGPVGLAWGVVLGAFLHMLIQYGDTRSEGFRWQWSFAGLWSDASVRKIIRLMIPRSLGTAVNQVSFVIMTVFASKLLSGSLSVFTLANNIQSVPLGLFGVAFSLAVFPSLSTLAAKKSNEEFFHLLANTFRRILFFVMPISVLMIVSRAQIVRVILGSGQFDWEDTIATFGALGILSVSLFAQSLIPLLSRAFFALQDTKTPLYVAIGSEAIHVWLTIEWSRRFGIDGLTAAFSAATILNMSLLYLFMRKKSGFWSDRDIALPSMKIIIASVFAGLVAQITKTSFGLVGSELDTFVEIFIQLAVTSFAGCAAFVAASLWLRIEEFYRMWRFIRGKLLRRPDTLVEAEEELDRGAGA